MERDGGIEPPTLAWKAKVIPFYESRKIFGAPRQNRTAITGLQNQCTAIVLVGQKLAPRRGLEPRTSTLTVSRNYRLC